MDNRFPTLGFTVDAGGFAAYEVVLAASQELLDEPARDRRSPNNYYSSAEHSGMIAPATDLYLVPAAVLPRFAGVTRLYYVAIGHAGDGRVASHTSAEAPYVTLAQGFTGRALGAMFSVSVENMWRVRDDGQPAAAGLTLPAQGAPDASDDAAEGEDGYGLESAGEAGALESDSVDYEDEPMTASEAEALADYSDDAQAFAHEAEESDQFLDPPPVGLEIGAPENDSYYDDGFGPRELSGEESLEAAGPEAGCRCGPASEASTESYDEAAEFDSSFPAGVRAPMVLEDEDQDRQEEGADTSSATALEEYSDDSYDDRAAEGLAEEQPELDADVPAYESLESTSIALTPPPLTIADKLAIMNQIARFESGPAGFAAMNADGEFEGRFPNHPATGRYHIGLSYGFIQFTQDGGNLGRLLAMMRARDGAKFRQVFGADADTLVSVLTAAGPPSRQASNGRSARVQPVGGVDVWREPWLSRFREAARADLFGAGNPQLFNGAQNQLAAERYLDPMLPFAKHLGLNTDRALAMVFDRAVQMGTGGARRWIVEPACPITTAQRQQAFQALGFTDLRAFQQATPGLTVDGNWGPGSHAALVGALRATGSRSPIPIPSRDQMLDALVRAARGRSWAHRVSTLRNSTAFNDSEFQL